MNITPGFFFIVQSNDDKSVGLTAELSVMLRAFSFLVYTVIKAHIHTHNVRVGLFAW